MDAELLFRTAPACRDPTCSSVLLSVPGPLDAAEFHRIDLPRHEQDRGAVALLPLVARVWTSADGRIDRDGHIRPATGNSDKPVGLCACRFHGDFVVQAGLCRRRVLAPRVAR